MGREASDAGTDRFRRGSGDGTHGRGEWTQHGKPWRWRGTRQPTAREGQVGPCRAAERPVVCARQRNGQEGSSPSGPRMRGAVSKGGGNASPAAGGRYGDTYTGTQAKAGHSQGGPGAPTTELRRTGRPSRGGVRRVCGAVPGRSRGGDPMTNRSAKGGARSSLHYGGEGALIHPPHQGVCGRHGTEDQCVTLGDLGGSAGGTAATDPISESEVGRDARRGVGRPSSVRQAAHWSGGLKSLRPPDEGGRIQRRG